MSDKLRERSAPPQELSNNAGEQEINGIDVGTSCSDLNNSNNCSNSNIPFVVETCQICNLLVSKEETTVHSAPYYSYSPCLYGHQVVLKQPNHPLNGEQYCAKQDNGGVETSGSGSRALQHKR